MQNAVLLPSDLHDFDEKPAILVFPLGQLSRSHTKHKLPWSQAGVVAEAVIPAFGGDGKRFKTVLDLHKSLAQNKTPLMVFSFLSV